MSIPATMRAVLLTGHGGFDKLELRHDVPVPKLGPGDVLIKVGTVGVNNTDINARIGWYSKDDDAGTDPARLSNFRAFRVPTHAEISSRWAIALNRHGSASVC
jgi:hypothetical protein